MPRLPTLLLHSLGVAMLLVVGNAQALTLLAPASSQATPREITTLVAQLQSSSDEAAEVNVTAELPAGWRLVLPTTDLVLNPGSAQAVLLPVQIPADAAAGEHTIVITATSAGQSQSVRTTVTVDTVRELTARVSQAPTSVLPEQFEVLFHLSNLGNATEQLTLTATSNHRLAVTADPAEVTLAPGASTPVSITVAAPRALERPLQHALTLRAITSDGQVVRATATTEITALAQSDSLAYHTFPVELNLSLRAQGEPGNPRLGVRRAEVRGSGRLSEGSDTTLGFIARYGATPTDRHFEVRLTTPTWKSLFGKQKQKLGPLQPEASGYGVSYRTLNQNSRFELYALAGDNGANTGFSYTLPLQSAEISVHGAFNRDSSIISVHGLFPTKLEDGAGFTLQVEPAVDLSSGNYAFHTQVTAEADDVTLQGEFQHHQAGYQGANEPRTDVDFSARARLPYVNINVRQQWANQGDESGKRTSITLQGTTSLEAGKASWGARYRYQSGLLSSNNVSAEHNIRVNGRLNPSVGTNHSAAITWATRQLKANTNQQLIRVDTASSMPLLGGRATAGFSIEYNLTDTSFTRALLSTSWSGQLTPTTSGRLNFRHDLAGTRDTRFTLSATHQLDDSIRATTSLEARTTSTSPWNLRAELSLHIPFDIRVAPREGVSEISGRLQTPDGNDLPNLVIHLAGYSTVTRSDGSFTFPAIPEGEHTLLVQALDQQLIAIPSLPLRITAPHSEPVEITVMPAATIHGQVHIQTPTTSPNSAGSVSSETPASLAGIRILLSNGSDEHQTFTNSTGHYEFSHLPPGTWSLTLDANTIPDGLNIVQSDQPVTTIAGQASEITQQLNVVQRNIRITGGGELSH